MRKARILLILGVWTALLPYLGFPSVIKNILFSLTGLAVIYFSYVFYLAGKKIEKSESKVFENFSENQDFSETNSTEDSNVQKP
jgi:hypothetical protein